LGKIGFREETGKLEESKNLHRRIEKGRTVETGIKESAHAIKKDSTDFKKLCGSTENG